MSSSDFRQPDPGPLRAAAEGAELAHAVSRLASAGRHRLADSAPPAPLARDITRSLSEAGFSMHHRARPDPLYGPGGVCLRPLPMESGTGHSGTAESWTMRNLLPDGDRHSTNSGARRLMTAAPARALRAFGYATTQLGSVGAWRATGQLNHDAEARR